MKPGSFATIALTASYLLFSAAALSQTVSQNPLSPTAPQTPTAPNPAVPQPQYQPGDPNAPKLWLSTREWDFGTVWYGAPLETEVEIRNDGRSPLTFRVTTGCGCTVAQPKKTELAPGESDKFKITYDSKKRIGAVTQTVTVTCNDPDTPTTTITVRGEVKQLFETDLNPPNSTMVSLGRLSKDSQVTKTVTIRNQYPEKLVLKLVEDLPGPVDSKLEEVEPGSVYKLILKTRPPLSEGALSSKVTLETGIPNVPQVTFMVNGYVQARVTVQPPTLWVPESLTRESERVIRFSYQADRPVKITKIESNHPKITARQTPVPAGGPETGFQVVNITVSLPPASDIPADGAKLTIETDDQEYPRFEVAITKNRPQPQATLSPTPAVNPLATQAPPQPAGLDAGKPGQTPASPAPPEQPQTPKKP